VKYDNKAMLGMATEFLFSKKYGIWIRKIATKEARCLSIFNERDEVLYPDLEFCTMPSVVYRNEDFKRSTRMTLDQAFQVAHLYVEKINSKGE
jgi:hypothetical protein